MSFLLATLKTIGGPGSLGFYLATLVLAILIAWRRPLRRRVVTAAVVALTAVYLLLALPVVAVSIVDALPRTDAPDAAAVDRIQSLVVFDGDNRAGRERVARQILRRSTPSEVHLLGTDHLLAALRAALGPTTTLHYDASTWNTATQVEHVRPVVGQWPPMTIAVVASRVQMPRISALLDTDHTLVLLIPSPLDREPATHGIARFVPSIGALLASRDAIYEHAALIYYRWRGDIR